MQAWTAWLAGTPVARAMRDGVWLYPAVETVHIIGFAVLVGAVAMFDLRVLGFARRLPVRALGAHVLPWAAASLLLIVPAGLLMFASAPQDFIANPTFRLKLALLAAAGVNAALFHVGVYRGVAHWDAGVAAPVLARAQALLSLLLWTAIVACGRLLAYT
ncbi:hypothetical protein IP92_02786 [Pseudoduganella flava]|uniref:DUF6644 domain-containing protein n=1 Tax=Pseudoduganella flava TaxID=871742 RepID=A0A562PTG6_9BURK|nr:DUF6644 family protein [Pseudoduganella flava]QGZ39009.1 hypothetical protein GO485_08070 [Pseudoduganella flava]TWI47725.1 hypothetical protein IP92_02786 [Pseudoduganella flava]